MADDKPQTKPQGRPDDSPRSEDGSRGGGSVAELESEAKLLEALLLPSGADAAYTLANTYGPGLDTFLARMNATKCRVWSVETSVSIR